MGTQRAKGCLLLGDTGPQIKIGIAGTAAKGAHDVADRQFGPGHHGSERRGVPLQIVLLLHVWVIAMCVGHWNGSSASNMGSSRLRRSIILTGRGGRGC